MSVSLALIPVALALRVVMGKDKLDEFVQSNEVPKKTNFTSERDLIVTVKQCGYDAEKWGGMIKTHLHGEKQFFFWELRDGAWHAIFSTYDTTNQINDFMEKINERSGRNIFAEVDSEQVVETHKPLTQILPTNFRNMELLKQVLQDNGIELTELENGKIRCDLADASLTFIQEVPDGLVSVELSSPENMQSIFRHLSVVDDDYKRYVQNQVYQHLLEKVEEKGLLIEQEEVLEDHSIVVTLNVQR
ncbi:hypothetical protein [Bacillus sp. B15-48]|uniref:hypothetical protein n=1 Tax=Bacillus sp. B15-48 TaxID=1548601 RepID=UPI00193F0487|nr:hypothetical protein [Bacillus sp. B15-48]MBM4763817.1 hypothetical protein [Bacillus sp. B15-48]